MSEELLPKRIEKTENRELLIEWSDGNVQTIGFRKLRDGCQCATCCDKRMKPDPKKPGELTVLSAAETKPLDIVEMRPVGNYAYNICFSDGHNTGIFTLPLLRSFEPASS